jgi:hypothetical protein
MNVHFFAALLLILSGCRSHSQEHKPSFQKIQRQSKPTGTVGKGLDSADIHYQLRGHCYAYSSPSNAVPSNGEAHSDNTAQPVDPSFPHRGLYLEINEKELIKIGNNYLGCKLYLVNTSGAKVSFNAQDSRLDIIAEALNEKNEWVPVSYLPSSWCGNSYHTLTLDNNEYWSFAIPIFKGKVKTRLRYTLLEKDKPKISSNEIIAFLNKEQFDPGKKQGHEPSGIMDPYND